MVLGPFGNNKCLQCFNMTITDDDVPEESEEFMVNVTFCPVNLYLQKQPSLLQVVLL